MFPNYERLIEEMDGGQRCETEWEGVRLVIEERRDYFQVFIYDPGKCEVLYTCL